MILAALGVMGIFSTGFAAAPGDLVPDGRVDIMDLQAFCQQWLNEGDDWPADLNHDEIVNNGDLNSLAKNWHTFYVADTFDDSGSLTRWTIVDEGTKSGPSTWQVVNEELYEPSNIYGPAVL